MLIKSLNHDGRGIGFLEGKVIFVKNALPYENVDIKITKSHKKYDEAVATRILNKNKERVESMCPYYSQCGGCHMLHASYNLQLFFKQNKISNIIDKYLDKKVMINDIIYDKQFNYRNKVTLQVNHNIGFYKMNSNDLVSIDYCLICSDKINDKIDKLNKLKLDNISQIVIRVSECENIICIISDDFVDIQPIYNEFDNIVVVNNRQALIKKGKKYIVQQIGDIIYQISIESFFQVNYSIMKKMYDYIKECIIGYDSVLDLYCGTGSIALYISSSLKRVYGIEINREAIKDANINKRLNNIDNVEFLCSDTKDIELNQYYDVIIVDPPRFGLNKKIIKQIMKSNCKKIIYVSCDPMTLVRDLKELSIKYDIISITPFDMFPNTYHVESVTLLCLKTLEK